MVRDGSWPTGSTQLTCRDAAERLCLVSTLASLPVRQPTHSGLLSLIQQPGRRSASSFSVFPGSFPRLRRESRLIDESWTKKPHLPSSTQLDELRNRGPGMRSNSGHPVVPVP